jgi:hypothetical protein
VTAQYQRAQGGVCLLNYALLLCLAGVVRPGVAARPSPLCAYSLVTLEPADLALFFASILCQCLDCAPEQQSERDNDHRQRGNFEGLYRLG